MEVVRRDAVATRMVSCCSRRLFTSFLRMLRSSISLSMASIAMRQNRDLPPSRWLST